MYKQGDILVNKDGDKRRVLAVCGEVYAVSRLDDFDSFYLWLTEKDIKDYSYTVEQAKWKPKEGEEYWLIRETGEVRSAMWEDGDWYDCACRNFLGAYRTEQEAQTAADKIRDIIKGE